MVSSANSKSSGFNFIPCVKFYVKDNGVYHICLITLMLLFLIILLKTAMICDKHNMNK